MRKTAYPIHSLREAKMTYRGSGSARTISRRLFLKSVIAVAVVAVAGYGIFEVTKPPPMPTPTPTTPTPTPAQTPTPTPTRTPTLTQPVVVSIVKGTPATGRRALIEKALELIGGIQSTLPSGSRVLVKPNVAFYARDATTEPDVVASITEIVRETSPEALIVGDSSVRGYDTTTAFKSSGIAEAVKNIGVECRSLAEDSVEAIDIPNGVTIRKVSTYRTVRESTFIISVPKLKRHGSTEVTISLKNMIGVVTDDEKGRFHRDGINQSIADLNSTLKPNLTIIDATRVMTERGPTGGKMVELNTIMASRDPVAADLIAAEVLFGLDGKSSPNDAADGIVHIWKAAELGVGSADRSKIKVLEATLD